jgi:L-amino acid N-acyltransferase YncA
MARRTETRGAGCMAGALLVAPIAATDGVALQFGFCVMKIREAANADRDGIWEIFREVIVAGETYPLERNISREAGLAYWFQRDAHVWVAEKDLPASAWAQPGRQIVGSYSLHPNQSGGGAHVANAAFIVAKEAQGQGIGRALGEHCLNEARRLGFRTMQFNYVISTNIAAVKLWQDLGMEIVGTLPGAFRHPEKGYVDVYVMYRSLLTGNATNARQ